MSNENTYNEDVFYNPNLIPFDARLTREKEQALLEFGKWWEGRLVSEGGSIGTFQSINDINPRFGLRGGIYTLLTHHTKSETSKNGILRLGGVVYWPDSQQTQYFGQDAGRQLRASLGEKKTGHTPYGKVKDGKTFVYLHSLPYELHEDARVYLEGPSGFALARAFSDNPPDYNRSRTKLEQVLQAPWERLDAVLTNENGLKLIKQNLPEYRNQLEKNPDFVHQLRMTENRYLIAII